MSASLLACDHPSGLIWAGRAKAAEQVASWLARGPLTELADSAGGLSARSLSRRASSPIGRVTQLKVVSMATHAPVHELQRFLAANCTFDLQLLPSERDERVAEQGAPGERVARVRMSRHRGTRTTSGAPQVNSAVGGGATGRRSREGSWQGRERSWQDGARIE